MSVEFDCTFVHETDSAILVKHTESGEELWFPLSAVESMHRDAKGEGTMVVADWIARKKGIA